MPSVDQGLRDSPLEDVSDPDRLLYYLNRELGAVVRKMLRFLNVSWGESVDVTEDHVVGLPTEYIRADATTGSLVITLLDSETAILGVRLLTIKRMNGGGNTVTWLTRGTDDVDGATSGALSSQYEVVRLRPRAGGYDII